MQMNISYSNKCHGMKLCLDALNEIKVLHPSSYKKEMRMFIKNKKVINLCNSKEYIVNDISYDLNIINKEIKLRNNQKNIIMKLNDYFKNFYNINLKDKYQPLLISQDSKSINYLVPELCYIIKKSKVIKDTNLCELENIDKFRKMFYYKEEDSKKYTKKGVGIWPNDVRQRWGIDFSSFIEIKSRPLSKPIFTFDNCNIILIRSMCL